jgi:uridine kinase
LPQPVTYSAKGQDIIIIEGVIGLSSTAIREITDLKLFTSLPWRILESRIMEYYTWRGKIAKEIQSLVDKRKVDEYQLIEKESKFADMIINPTGS